MKTFLRTAAVFVIAVTAFVPGERKVLAYDDKYVHPLINHYAALRTEGSNVDAFVRQALGFPLGIEKTLLLGKSILEWIKDGGTKEDQPPQWLHHFHDPLKAWWHAGLKDGLFGVSSVYWAQGDTIDERTWHELRGLYYLALLEGKEAYWMRTFRGLGQLMHLVADMACPAHVRDDMHPQGDPYENWAQVHKDALDYLPILLNRQIFTRAVANGMVPITALWDQDRYDGSNPSEGLDGLAEYTNAYFFSKDTLNFSESYEYPHPNVLDTDFSNIDWENPEEVDREDGKIDKKIYLKHTASSDPYRLAAAAYFAQDCMAPKTCWSYAWLLDDQVHKDYAARLIPRATGYAAALLDYFFRGTIEVLPGSNGLYSFYNPVDPTGDPGGFQTITLRARNSTSNPLEPMSDGVIKLLIKHKVALSDPFVSEEVPVSDAFTYLVASERNGVGSLPADGYTEIIFNLPQPIPVTATDLYLQVVFRGKLGAEEGAIAVGFKDISEPTPFDVFNNMDKVCLNGAWFTAGSSEALALADANQNGIVEATEWDVFPHTLTSVSLRFFPYSTATPLYPPPSQFQTTNLESGGSHRVFLLSDPYYRYSASTAYYAPTAAFSAIDQFPHGYFAKRTGYFNTIKRQTDTLSGEICASYGMDSPCEVNLSPKFFSFRGRNLWSGVIYLNAAYPSGTACSLETLTE